MKCFPFLLLIWLHGSLLAQKPELIVPVGHTDWVTSVAMSPDGQYLLTGSQDKTFNLWNHKGHLIRGSNSHQGAVKAVAFSPDGQSLLTASSDDSAKLWNLQGDLLQSFAPEAGDIYSLAFSLTGDSILMGCQRGQAVLYNLKGEKLKVFSAPDMFAVYSAVFSPNGKYVLTGSNTLAGASDREGNQIQAPGDHVRIWDIKTSKVKSYPGHQKEVYTLAFSPDGTKFLSASNDKTLLVRNLAGEVLHKRSWEDMYVVSACFSPDGKKILYAGIDLGIWDLETDSIQIISPNEGKTIIQSVAYSPDQQHILAGSKNGNAYMWDLDGELLQTFQGHSLPFNDALFSPEGSHILSGSYEAILWDLREPIVSSLPGLSRISSVDFSSDGHTLLAGGYGHSSRIWDREGHSLQVFAGDSSWISSVSISHDGQSILTGCEDGSATLWDRDGRVLCKISLDDLKTANNFSKNHIYEVALSPDGQRFLVADWNNDIARMYDRKGQQTGEFPIKGKRNVVESLHFSPDGQHIAIAERQGKITIRNLKGNRIRSFQVDEKWLTCIAFSEDWQRILVGSYEGKLWLLDEKGKEILSFQGHRNHIRAVSISPDGQFLLSGGADHELKIWDLQAKELARLHALREGDWVVSTPAGLFDASPGAMEKMHFIQGLNIIELEQLKERYYEPGLLSKTLGFAEGGVRDVEVFGQLALYPEATLDLVHDQLRISLTERRGGIGKVSVFVNHKEVIPDANPERKQEIEVNLKQFRKYYQPGENQLAVRVYNQEGWLKSEEKSISYSPSFSLTTSGKTSLYAITIGTSDYNGEKLDLQFASDDAQAMATAISSAGQQLFADRVYTYVLTSESDPEHRPSKSIIQKTFQEVAEKAHPEDILLVFLSGHGVTYGGAEKANFYYLTQDIASEDLSDTEIRTNYTISDEELTQWINQIAAKKQVMIVDACNSGKVVENLLSGRKALNSTQVIALDRMKDRTGMFVLAGSAADKSSFEATQFGQGLLTYSLLSGLKGGAIQQNEPVDVMKLFQFSRDEVPRLARRIDGIQTPMLAFPGGGESFDIGIINSEVEVPIGIEIPRMIPSVFLDPEEIDDWLDLASQLNQYLRQYAAKNGKGKLLYSPSQIKDEGCYSVRGLYTLTGNTLKVKVKLRKGSEVLHEFEVEEEQEELEKMTIKIMEEIVGKL